MMTFKSKNKNTDDFLRMNNLLAILEDKSIGAKAKAERIKAERDAGFLTEDEAIDLAVEFI